MNIIIRHTVDDLDRVVSGWFGNSRRRKGQHDGTQRLVAGLQVLKPRETRIKRAILAVAGRRALDLSTEQRGGSPSLFGEVNMLFYFLIRKS